MQVKLPDGGVRELAEGASSADLAALIGPGLAKAAVAAKVGGQIVDLSRPLSDGGGVDSAGAVGVAAGAAPVAAGGSSARMRRAMKGSMGAPPRSMLRRASASSRSSRSLSR